MNMKLKKPKKTEVVYSHSGSKLVFCSNWVKSGYDKKRLRNPWLKNK